MKINFDIDDKAVLAKFDKMPDKIRNKLINAVDGEGKDLMTYVKNQKLMGQVLNRRSGDLGRGVFEKLTINGDVITSKVAVSNDVKYAAIHEYGGTTSEHMIYPKKGMALAFQWKGKQVFFKSVKHPGSKIPERSYMRSSLRDNKDKIQNTIRKAVAGAIHE